MKKLTLIITALLLAGVVAAEPYITIQSCYQRIEADAGTGFNVIAGVAYNLAAEDFNDVDVYYLVDQVRIGTYGSGQVFVPEAGTEYLLYPAGTFPTSIQNAVVISAVTPSIEIIEANNQNGCIAFGESLDLSPTLSGFFGLCNFHYEIYNPFSGNTTNVYSHSFSIPDEDYCTPLPGTSWSGGPRCTTIVVTLVIEPCEQVINCPPLEFPADITVCCNNCQPYTSTGSKRGLTFNDEGQSGLRVYPNPAHETLTIAMGTAALQGTVYVYNANGLLVAKVLCSEMKDGELTGNIDVRDWTAGLYFFNVQAGNDAIRTGKFAVAR